MYVYVYLVYVCIYTYTLQHVSVCNSRTRPISFAGNPDRRSSWNRRRPTESITDGNNTNDNHNMRNHNNDTDNNNNDDDTSMLVKS